MITQRLHKTSGKTNWHRNYVSVYRQSAQIKALCTYSIYELYHTTHSYANNQNVLNILWVVIQAQHNSNLHQLTQLRASLAAAESCEALHCSKHAHTRHLLVATGSRMLLAVRLATLGKETLTLEIHLTRLHVKQHNNCIKLAVPGLARTRIKLIVTINKGTITNRLLFTAFSSFL